LDFGRAGFQPSRIEIVWVIPKENVPMYSIFYGLKHRPFQLLPNPDYLYAGPHYKRALNLMRDGLRVNIGPLLLTGEAGTGKTTLIRYMLSHFCSDKQVATIFSTNVSSEELLSLILLAFKVNRVNGGKTSKFDLLRSFLKREKKADRQVLLIVDEAQNLSLEALEDIQRLSSLEIETAPLISIILVGQPEIMIELNNPRLFSFVQRMVVKYHLKSLTHQETDAYIAYRLRKAGGSPNLFESEAVELIHRYSGGIPRSINVVCNAALVYGFGYKLKTIGIPVIEEIIQDRKGLEPPNEADAEAKASIPESTDELRQRLLNVEDTVRVLQIQLDRLTAELSRKTKSVKDDLSQEMKEQSSAGREHRDSIMSEYIQLREKFESFQRSQTAAAKGGRILIPSAGESNPLVKGKSRGGFPFNSRL